MIDYLQIHRRESGWGVLIKTLPSQPEVPGAAADFWYEDPRNQYISTSDQADALDVVVFQSLHNAMSAAHTNRFFSRCTRRHLFTTFREANSFCEELKLLYVVSTMLMLTDTSP